MMSFPLTEIEAKIHMKRLKGNCNIVGANGNFFIREKTPAKTITGIEADLIIMHGRAQGRHSHSKADRRVIAKKLTRAQPRILA